jgi:hypothetical protein
VLTADSRSVHVKVTRPVAASAGKAYVVLADYRRGHPRILLLAPYVLGRVFAEELRNLESVAREEEQAGDGTHAGPPVFCQTG